VRRRFSGLPVPAVGPITAVHSRLNWLAIPGGSKPGDPGVARAPRVVKDPSLELVGVPSVSTTARGHPATSKEAFMYATPRVYEMAEDWDDVLQ
jgi:hypothetical protein